jgi:hypothetical protein
MMRRKAKHLAKGFLVMMRKKDCFMCVAGMVCQPGLLKDTTDVVLPADQVPVSERQKPPGSTLPAPSRINSGIFLDY